MSFWNDPKYSSVRIILVIVIVFALGYFVSRAVRMSSLDQSGRVYEKTPVVSDRMIDCTVEGTYIPEGSSTGGECEILMDGCGDHPGTVNADGQCCDASAGDGNVGCQDITVGS